VLCTYQWLRETDTRQTVQSLHNTRFKLESEIQQHTNRIHHMDLRIAELADNTVRLEGLLRTNELTIVGLRDNLNTAESTNQLLLAQLDVYTNAFTQATNQLAKAYDDIKAQNDLIKQVAAQRDEFVTKLNEAIEERNKVVGQYNELVQKVEEFQAKMDAATQPRRR